MHVKARANAAVNAKPKILKTDRILLADISVQEDSGWRELDPERVSELQSSFEGGEYGIGILTIPSMLCVDGKVKESTFDGRGCLNNGKSTVAVLKQLERESQQESQIAEPGVTAGTAGEGSEACPPSWVCGELADIFESGLRCDFVEYQSDDKELVLAWNGLSHDQDSSKYQQTDVLALESQASQQALQKDHILSEECVERHMKHDAPRAHSLRPLSLANERAFYERGIQIGADGSLVQDGDVVFLINAENFGLHKIDYFHGCNAWGAVGQTFEEYDFAASEVISIKRSRTLHAIWTIQRRWRHHKEARIVDTVLAIARCCVRPSRKGKFVLC